MRIAARGGSLVTQLGRCAGPLGVLTALVVAPPVPAQVFVDATVAAGLTTYASAFGGMATGAAAADFDGDGWIDVYLPTSETTPNRLYRNLGNGSFEEIAAQAGVESTGVSRSALWLDHDGDGDLDLLVAGDCRLNACGGESALRLYRQNADQTFTDVTTAAGLWHAAKLLDRGSHRSGLAAGDLDNDGDLDIYAGMWGDGAAGLFFNDGDGTFTNHSGASGASSTDAQWQPVMHDFDGDGWLDIYVTIDFTADHLWVNQQDGTFDDMAPNAGTAGAFNEMGIALGDHDRDGDFDIYITNIYRAGRHNRLYRNDTTPAGLSFTGIAESLGVGDTGWGWGTTFLDGDNEGQLDIAATNGFATSPWSTDSSAYFENQGGSPPSFTDVSTATGFDDTYYGSSLLAFDCDRDGDLDLLQSTVGAEGPARLRLLENQLDGSGPADHYLTVRPRMAGSNTHAIGAVVRVSTGAVQQARLITAGTSLLGQEPAEAFFGLGGAAAADELVVEWPDGVDSRFQGVGVDRLLTVRRGTAADLAVSVTDGASEIAAPGSLTYTVQVTNLGQGDVTGATVAASLPAGIACGGWTCAAAAGSCAASSPPGGLADTVDLLVGGALTYSVECAVPWSAAGSELLAAASVAGPAESPDPAPADNSAADTTTVTPCADPAEQALAGLTVVGQETYRACDSISLGDSTVEAAGELVLHAPRVRLDGGVVIRGLLEAGTPP